MLLNRRRSGPLGGMSWLNQCEMQDLTIDLLLHFEICCYLFAIEPFWNLFAL